MTSIFNMCGVLLFEILLVCAVTSQGYQIQHLGCLATRIRDPAIPELLNTYPVGQNNIVQKCARVTSLKGYRVFGLRTHSGAIGCFSGENAYIEYKQLGFSNNCLNGVGSGLSNDVYSIMVFNLTVKVTDKNELFDIRLLKNSNPSYITSSNITRQKIHNAVQSLDGVWEIEWIQFRPLVNTGIMTLVSLKNINGTYQLDNITSALQSITTSALSTVTVEVVDMECQFNGLSLYLRTEYTKPSNLYCSKSYQIGVNMAPLTCNLTGKTIMNQTNAFLINPSYELKGQVVQLNTTYPQRVDPGQLPYGTYLIGFQSSVENVQSAESWAYGYITILPASPKLIVTSTPSSLSSINSYEQRTVNLSASLSFLDGCPPEAGFDSSSVTYFWYCRDSSEVSIVTLSDLKSLPHVDQKLNSSSHKGGCFGTGPGLLNTTSSMLSLNTSQLLTNRYLEMDVITIIGSSRVYLGGLRLQVVPKNVTQRNVFNLTVKVTDKNELFDIRLLKNSNPSYIARSNITRQNIHNAVQSLDGVWEIEWIQFRPLVNTGIMTLISLKNIDGTRQLDNITSALQSLRTSALSTVTVEVLDVECRFNGLSLYLNTEYTKPSTFYCYKSNQIGVRMAPLTCNLTGKTIMNQTNAFLINPSYELKGQVVQLNTTYPQRVDPGQLPYGTYLIGFQSSVENVQSAESWAYGYITISASPKLLVTSTPSSLSSINSYEQRTVNLSASLSFYNGCPPKAGFDSSSVTYFWYCRDSSKALIVFVSDLKSIPYVDQKLNSSSHKGGCFGTGPGLLNTTSSMLSLNTSQLLTNRYLVLDVMTIIGSSRIFRALRLQVVPKNVTQRNDSHSVNSDFVDFNTAFRLTSVNFTQALNDTCSVEYLELSKTVVNAIYMVYQYHKHYNVQNVQVVEFEPGTIVNFTYQVSRNYSEVTSSLFNSHVKTGTLPGNVAVDPFFLRSGEYKYAAGNISCPVNPSIVDRSRGDQSSTPVSTIENGSIETTVDTSTSIPTSSTSATTITPTSASTTSSRTTSTSTTSTSKSTPTSTSLTSTSTSPTPTSTSPTPTSTTPTSTSPTPTSTSVTPSSTSPTSTTTSTSTIPTPTSTSPTSTTTSTSTSLTPTSTGPTSTTTSTSTSPTPTSTTPTSTTTSTSTSPTLTSTSLTPTSTSPTPTSTSPTSTTTSTSTSPTPTSTTPTSTTTSTSPSPTLTSTSLTPTSTSPTPTSTSLTPTSTSPTSTTTPTSTSLTPISASLTPTSTSPTSTTTSTSTSPTPTSTTPTSTTKSTSTSPTLTSTSLTPTSTSPTPTSTSPTSTTTSTSTSPTPTSTTPTSTTTSTSTSPTLTSTSLTPTSTSPTPTSTSLTPTSTSPTSTTTSTSTSLTPISTSLTPTSTSPTSTTTSTSTSLTPTSTIPTFTTTSTSTSLTSTSLTSTSLTLTSTSLTPATTSTSTSLTPTSTSLTSTSLTSTSLTSTSLTSTSLTSTSLTLTSTSLTPATTSTSTSLTPTSTSLTSTSLTSTSLTLTSTSLTPTSTSPTPTSTSLTPTSTSPTSTTTATSTSPTLTSTSPTPTSTTSTSTSIPTPTSTTSISSSKSTSSTPAPTPAPTSTITTPTSTTPTSTTSTSMSKSTSATPTSTLTLTPTSTTTTTPPNSTSTPTSTTTTTSTSTTSTSTSTSTSTPTITARTTLTSSASSPNPTATSITSTSSEYSSRPLAMVTSAPTPTISQEPPLRTTAMKTEPSINASLPTPTPTAPTSSIVVKHSSDGVLYFTNIIRLVGLVNISQSALTDRCSHDFQELSSGLMTAIYALMDRHGFKGKVTNLQVLHFLPNGSANYSGQIDRDISSQAGEVVNKTIQTGSLGNFTVDPNYWIVNEHSSAFHMLTCKNGSHSVVGGLVDFNAAIKLTSVNFTQALNDTCSAEYLELSKTVVNAIYLVYQHHEQYKVSNFQVVQFEPGTIVNYTYQVSRNYSEAASSLLNSHVENGTLPGNVAVDPFFLRSGEYKYVPRNISCPAPSSNSSDDVLYFTYIIRLVGLVNISQSALTDRCSHDFLELSSGLMAAIYSLMDRHGFKGKLSNLQVLHFQPNGSANYSGQIGRDISSQAGEVLNKTIQTGSLGNFTVDPNYWIVNENSSAFPLVNCQNSSRQIPLVQIYCTFKLTSVRFSLSLLNKNSTAFQQLANQVINSTKLLYAKSESESPVQWKVNKFEKGSVVTHLSASVAPTASQSMQDIFKKAIQNGSLGSFQVDPKFIIITDKINVTSNSSCPMPTVSIPSLQKTLKYAYKILRSGSVTIKGKVSTVSCDGPEVFYSFKWIAAPIDKEGKVYGTEKTLNNQSASLYVKSNSLNYGLYMVQFYVTRNSTDIETRVDYGIIEITPTPLVAHIAGGNLVTRGFTHPIILDASKSYDPDVELYKRDGIVFTWLCRKVGESWPLNDLNALPIISLSLGGDSGCFGTGIGKLPLQVTPEKITIASGLLAVQKSYQFVVLLSKDDRTISASQIVKLVPGDPPDTKLRCNTNCGPSVNPSSKLSLEVTCPEDCDANTIYAWTLYIKTGQDSSGDPILQKLDNLQSLLLSKTSSSGFVVKPDKLKGGTEYRCQVEVTAVGRAKTSNEYVFTTNAPPYGGSCFISPQTGEALSTTFSLTCRDWSDPEKPLGYQFRYRKSDGAYAVLYHGAESSTTCRLPAGLKIQDYNINIEVLISDAFGATNSTSIQVKVTPKQAAPNTTIGNTLQSLTVGQSSDMANLLKTGNVDGATQLANAVLDAIDSTDKQESNSSVSTVTQEKIVTSIIDQMSEIKVENVETLTQVSSVVASATNNDKILTTESQSSALKILSALTNVLAAKSEDDSQQSGNLDKGGENLYYGIGNIWTAASQDASVTKTTQGKQQKQTNTTTSLKDQSISIAKQSSSLLKKVSSSRLSRMTPGEQAIVSRTSHLSIGIRRNKPYDIGGQNISLENSSFALPEAKTLFGSRSYNDSIIDFQMVYTKLNVYSWSDTSRYVTTSIVSFDLLDPSGDEVSFSNLTSPIVMTIPRENNQDKEANVTTLQPNYDEFLRYKTPMYRKIVVTIQGSSLQVKINVPPSIKGKEIVVITKFGERPTVDNNEFTTKVAESNGIYVIIVPGSVLSKKGTYFLGVFYQDIESPGKRVRRSCGGSGRQKRSCVDIRDPPTTSPPKNITVKPVFDPDRDVNISLTTDLSSCLYWSTSLEKWTSEGCVAGPESTPTSIQCLCNHLSTFGGNFVVAPNPIDFDVVILAFSQLDQTKNFSVIIFTAVLFLLYLIILVWCRRADKKDKAKVGPPIEMDHEPFHTGSYEITIETGLWFRSGTTANVAMTISGTENQSDVISIFQDEYPERRLFGRGNIDQFIIHTSSPLGELVYVRIWHDNSGENPSWLLRRIQIKDLTNGGAWNFPCNRWLDVVKDDGQLERTIAGQPEAFELNESIKHKTTQGFVDEHLWVSVMTRRPLTYFTRVQRATCCLSLLFSAMIANAMFYNIGGKTEKTFQIGPLQFSLRQIIIGVQSGLIVAPINLIIVQLFKVASKLRDQEEKDPFEKNMMVKRRSSSQQELLHKPRQTSKLSGFLKFVAYLLSLLCVIASATFTIFYSMQWGTDLSNQWLSSMLVSLVQDLFVLQPMKIIIIAVIFALIASKFNKKSTVERLNTHKPLGGIANLYKVDQEILDSARLAPLSEDQKRDHRKRTRQELKLMSTTKEIALYLVFFILLCLVCYGSRTNHGFLMNNNLRQTFAEFDQITDDNQFYEWLNTSLIHGLYATSWYNSRGVTNKAYISDKRSILLGMPRMRQIRVQQGHCTIPKEFQSKISRCFASYSLDTEYTTKVNYPGWKGVATDSPSNQSLTPETCPKPWKYHTSSEITSLPYWGLQHIYSGGGYVAHLGYQPDIASRVIKELSKSKWLDPRSSAVLIVFSVFNVNTEYASFLSFLYEKLPTGAGMASFKIHSVPLYAATVSFLVFQLLFLLFVAFYFVLMLIKVAKQKCHFFQDIWNCLDLLLVTLSVTTVVLQIIKGLYTSDVIRQIKANPYNDLSFDYAVMAIDVEDSLIALLVFVSTLKLLKLIKLDLRILILSSTMGVSIKDLAPYSIIFTVILLAYAQLGILIFGREEVAFSNVYNALATELQMFVGGVTDLWILEKKNRVLAPLYIFSFMVFMGLILMNVFIAILAEAQVNQEKRLKTLEEDFEFLDFMKRKVMTFFNIKSAKIKDVQNDGVLDVFKFDASNPNIQKPPSPVANNEIEPKLPNTESSESTKHKLSRTKKPFLKREQNAYQQLKTERYKKHETKVEENVLLIHKRLKKMNVLLGMLEMDLTHEDMQTTQMLLQIESNGGSQESSPVYSPPPTERRESTLTLSNLAFTEDFESEEELKQVFPLLPSNTSMNSRFRPVVMKRANVNKFVSKLKKITENNNN